MVALVLLVAVLMTRGGARYSAASARLTPAAAPLPVTTSVPVTSTAVAAVAPVLATTTRHKAAARAKKAHQAAPKKATARKQAARRRAAASGSAHATTPSAPDGTLAPSTQAGTLDAAVPLYYPVAGALYEPPAPRPPSPRYAGATLGSTPVAALSHPRRARHRKR